LKDYLKGFPDTSEDTIMDIYQTDVDKMEHLQRTLINSCTNDGPANDNDYKILRNYFLSKEETKNLLPSWIRTNRDLQQFWQFIKFKFSSYKERRAFIWQEFEPLLSYVDSQNNIPHFESINEGLQILNSESIMNIWQKAISRKDNDPEGAITIARTLLESVLKHILDELKIDYSMNIDLHELYKLVSNELNLSPEQHYEKLFKQILGGCSAIVSGLGTLRNKMGDAHGPGKLKYSKPSSRHAELAINLSGSMCLFLLQTFHWNNSK
jgi:hypothetical protein